MLYRASVPVGWCMASSQMVVLVMFYGMILLMRAGFGFGPSVLLVSLFIV